MKVWIQLLLIFVFHQVVGQNFIQSGLRQGPHKVGFKAGVHYDLGRPPIKEQFARFRQGRAVHISVWYPAVVKANHPQMIFAEYIDEISRMVNPKEVTKRTRTESIRVTNFLLSQLGGDSMIFKKHLPSLLPSPTNAYRNAASRSGSFPIIIYPESPHLNNILSEYLASYGYIVVSVSRHGSLTADFEWQSVKGIETLVQDCQFALSVVRKEFNSDGESIAAMGTGMNASAGLAWMMRNPSMDALVSLEGGIITGYEYDLIQKSPYFDITRVIKPMLVMHSPHESVNPELIDHYKYADRFMLDLPHMREFYYLNFGVWEKAMPGILGQAPGDTRLGFEWMAQYTLFFLDWQLKQGELGKTFFEETPEQHGVPEGLLLSTFKPGFDVPPTEKELLAIKNTEGFDDMLREVGRFQKQDSLAFSFETYVSIGQQLIAGKEFDEGARWALSFQERFPSAVSAHTIAGRCYLELGKKDNAVAMYSTALKLLPSDNYLQPGDKDQLKGMIEQRLLQLTQ